MAKYLVYDLDNPGKLREVDCIEENKEHRYGWSGSIPCTGYLRCIYCGERKPLDN